MTAKICWRAVFLLVAAFAASRAAAELPAVRFGVMSDTHVRLGKSGMWERVEKAFRLFKAQGVDAIVHCGDLADYHLVQGYTNYHDVIVGTYPDPAKRPQLLYVYANHDILDPSSLLGKRGDGNFVMKEKECFAEMSAILESPKELAQEREINGYAFLTFPESYGLVGGHDFIRQRLTAACSAHPGKPVFLFMHYPALGTIYGSEGGMGPGTRKLLDEFPQVVFFSGHIHNSVRNELNIWQDGFTAIDAGTLQEWYGSCVGTSISGKQGHDVLVAEAYPDRLVVKRFDTRTGEEVCARNRWSVPLPFDPKTAPYAAAAAKARERPAAFAAGAEIRITPDKTPFETVKVEFPDAAPVEDAFKYEIAICRADGRGGWTRISNVEVFGQFYLGAAERRPWLGTTFSSGYFETGTRYRFEVRAKGFRGTLGEPLAAEWTAPEMAAYETVWESANPAADCTFKACGWVINDKAGVRKGAYRTWKPDADGWFDVTTESRLLLPEGVWKAPAKTSFRFIAEYEMEQPEGVSTCVLHLNSILSRQAPLIGWTGTPSGRTGLARYVNDFVSKEADDDISVLFRCLTKARVRIHTIRIQKGIR